MEPEAEAAFYHVASKKQWVCDSGDDVFALTKSNTVEEWKQAILSTLERQSDKQCTLLALMTAAKLQSRSIKHPFNDALSTLVREERVLWNDERGKPIRIIVA